MKLENMDGFGIFNFICNSEMYLMKKETFEKIVSLTLLKLIKEIRSQLPPPYKQAEAEHETAFNDCLEKVIKILDNIEKGE